MKGKATQREKNLEATVFQQFNLRIIIKDNIILSKGFKTISGLLISLLGLYPRETLLKLKKKKLHSMIPHSTVKHKKIEEQ